MPNCDLSSDGGDYERFYYEPKKVHTKATCIDCGVISRKNWSYPLYSYNEDGDEKRVGTDYLCYDCHNLHDVFNVSVLGTARDRIKDDFFHDCWEKDFDMVLLDKLTPKAKEFVLKIIADIQENEE